MADPTIKHKKALIREQGGSLGGILTDDDIKSGVPEELITDIEEADREAGWDLPAKGFVKKETANPFTSGWLIISRISEGEDYLRIKEGTADDTWFAASGYVDWRGSGELAASGAIGASAFLVDFEEADGIFDGDQVVILNKTINKWERFLLADPGGVAWDGKRATLTIDGITTRAYPVKAKAYLLGTTAEPYSLSGLYLTIRFDGVDKITVNFTTETTAAEVAAAISLAASGYATATGIGGYVYIERDLYYYHHTMQIIGGAAAAAALGLSTVLRRGSDGTVIGSAISLGTIAASVGTPVVTSGAGTFNNSTYPILADEAGGVDDTITLTFSSATEFSASGVKSGTIGNGTISADFAPTNFSGVFFRLDYRAWGGTWGSGDKLVFTTTSSSKGFWIRSIGPAGCARIDPNRSGLKVIGSV